jgi:hypothetical protein
MRWGPPVTVTVPGHVSVRLGRKGLLAENSDDELSESGPSAEARLTESVKAVRCGAVGAWRHQARPAHLLRDRLAPDPGCRARAGPLIRCVGSKEYRVALGTRSCNDLNSHLLRAVRTTAHRDPGADVADPCDGCHADELARRGGAARERRHSRGRRDPRARHSRHQDPCRQTPGREGPPRKLTVVRLTP